VAIFNSGLTDLLPDKPDGTSTCVSNFASLISGAIGSDTDLTLLGPGMVPYRCIRGRMTVGRRCGNVCQEFAGAEAGGLSNLARRSDTRTIMCRSKRAICVVSGRRMLGYDDVLVNAVRRNGVRIHTSCASSGGRDYTWQSAERVRGLGLRNVELLFVAIDEGPAVIAYC